MYSSVQLCFVCCVPSHLQVERALLDLCLDPSDSFLAAVGVDMGSSIAEGSVTSSLRLYEVRWGGARGGV